MLLSYYDKLFVSECTRFNIIECIFKSFLHGGCPQISLELACKAVAVQNNTQQNLSYVLKYQKIFLQFEELGIYCGKAIISNFAYTRIQQVNTIPTLPTQHSKHSYDIDTGLTISIPSILCICDKEVLYTQIQIFIEMFNSCCLDSAWSFLYAILHESVVIHIIVYFMYSTFYNGQLVELPAILDNLAKQLYTKLSLATSTCVQLVASYLSHYYIYFQFQLLKIT